MKKTMKAAALGAAFTLTAACAGGDAEPEAETAEAEAAAPEAAEAAATDEEELDPTGNPIGPGRTEE